MKQSFYYIPIIFGILAVYIIINNSISNEVPSTPLPKIEQHVNILDDDKKSTLEYRWVIDNEDDLKAGKIKFADCPYSGEKTIYKLKTSMDSISSFVYGTQVEIERQKCTEYNKFINIRKDLINLNKPTTCK